jgi:AraC-like DNA-binding protein
MALFLSLLSMILALVVLAFNWKVNRNALFLSLLMILIATLQIRQYLSLTGTHPFWLAIFINNPAPLWSMIGPCLWFYVRNVLTDRMTFRRSDLLHTIPFWVSLAGTLPYLLTPFSYKLEVAYLDINNSDAAYHIRYNWLMSNQWNNLSRSAVQVGYAVACLWMLARFQRIRVQEAFATIPKGGMIYKWLIAVSVFVLLTGIYYFTGAFLFFRNPSLASRIVSQYNVVYAFGVLLACLPSIVLIFPEILYGIPRRRDAPGLVGPQKVSPETPDATAPPAGTATPEIPTEAPRRPEGPEDDPLWELGQRVIDLLEREKPYLQKDFSVEYLAVILGVPRHHLYYCFKNVLKQTFVQLRNKHRIEEAKRRLLTADLQETTLANIGFECGFSAHSTFYRIFTELEGCTPGEFVERQKQAD